VRKITAVLSISIDGVIQAPGRPDEDTRGGFERGGWAVPYNDDVMAQRMGENMSSSGAMLFGRRTYEDFYGYWPKQTDNPFTPYLNAATKYVVSTTLTEPLPWQNSSLLSGDPAKTVADLKSQSGPDLGGRRQRPPGEVAAEGKPHRPIPIAHTPTRAGPRSAPF
jgi:dihydrofolate reductase